MIKQLLILIAALALVGLTACSPDKSGEQSEIAQEVGSSENYAGCYFVVQHDEPTVKLTQSGEQYTMSHWADSMWQEPVLARWATDEELTQLGGELGTEVTAALVHKKPFGWDIFAHSEAGADPFKQGEVAHYFLSFFPLYKGECNSEA